MRAVRRALVAAALTVGLTAAPALVATADAQPQGGVVVKAKILDFKFVPKNLVINQNDTVKWVNRSMENAHTSTANGGAWDSGVIAPGANFTHTFATAGQFKYHCTIHPTMKGTVTVNPV
jgi:plastocyanin